MTYLFSAVLGFFLIAVMPIALSMLEEFKTVGPELSGASTGLAFWFGNLGGFLGTILLEALRVGDSYLYSIVYLVVVMAVATVLLRRRGWKAGAPLSVHGGPGCPFRRARRFSQRVCIVNREARKKTNRDEDSGVRVSRSHGLGKPRVVIHVEHE